MTCDFKRKEERGEKSIGPRMKYGHPATKITHLFLQRDSIGMPTVDKRGILFDVHLNAVRFLGWTFSQVTIKRENRRGGMSCHV